MTPGVPPATPARDFLPGGGEMGERIRSFNWYDTPVGPIESWPESLRTAVRICLASCYPIVIWWGNPALTMFYNDAYISVLGGAKHPRPSRDAGPRGSTPLAAGPGSIRRDDTGTGRLRGVARVALRCATYR